MLLYRLVIAAMISGIFCGAMQLFLNKINIGIRLKKNLSVIGFVVLSFILNKFVFNIY